MSSFSLRAMSALDDALFEVDGVRLQELPEVRLLSIAAAASRLDTASQALLSSCNIQWPSIGQSSNNEHNYALGLQAEQIFLMCQHSTDSDIQRLAYDLSQSAYVTDQSDSWVVVEVSGDRRHAALERSCPLDLDDAVFIDGSVARTAMEHLSVVLMRDNNRFILLSPRSSAQNFWHMLTVSASNIVENA